MVIFTFDKSSVSAEYLCFSVLHSMLSEEEVQNTDHKTNKNSECFVISPHPSAKHGYNFFAQAPMVEVRSALVFWYCLLFVLSG